MKVLLVDAAFGAAPIYAALIEAGHDVWVISKRPDDLLARAAADRWIQEDYSDAAIVQRLIDYFKFEAIVPGCTDISLETCLKVSRQNTTLDTAAANYALSHKSTFREVCELLNLPAPRLVKAAQFPRQGRYICKPVDAFSGRGITVFDGQSVGEFRAALAAAQSASRSGEALVETLVDGPLYSCSGFLKTYSFEQVFFVREGMSANPYAVDTSYVVDDLQSSGFKLVVDGLERLARHLELKDGLLHTQFLMSDGGPSIVEVTRRCPGDLYSLLIEYATGYPYAAKYAACAAGYEFTPGRMNRRYILRHTVTADSKSIFGGLYTFPSAPFVAFFPIAKMGDELLARQGNRAGILFTEYPDTDHLLRAYDGFLKRQSYSTTGALPNCLGGLNV
ncbi:hypothetical protein [Bradyrhizobium sp. WSM1253]|uniref:hypothetical protein n=1 Tax=Bradyrhizobium sp. WSM1253 TaxID=319003 RepID=UPI00025D2E13|nr:hypothetical protein [Bradyrhizobium sp. WSM1253]EIG63513.1 hypothetical protein Bra1253DRAFT_08492 [Bradyrhizobium sp. WSM1253]